MQKAAYFKSPKSDKKSNHFNNPRITIQAVDLQYEIQP